MSVIIYAHHGPLYTSDGMMAGCRWVTVTEDDHLSEIDWTDFGPYDRETGAMLPISNDPETGDVRGWLYDTTRVSYQPHNLRRFFPLEGKWSDGVTDDAAELLYSLEAL
jgi:hypothetical protein